MSGSNGTLSPEAAKLFEQMQGGGFLPGTAPVDEKPRAKPVKGKSAATAGRFKVMNEFADFSAKTVSTTAQAAWWILFRETKPNGLASASFNQIATAIGKGRRAAIYAVQELEQAKLVTVVKRGSLNVGPSIYRIHGVAN